LKLHRQAAGISHAAVAARDAVAPVAGAVRPRRRSRPTVSLSSLTLSLSLRARAAAAAVCARRQVGRRRQARRRRKPGRRREAPRRARGCAGSEASARLGMAPTRGAHLPDRGREGEGVTACWACWVGIFFFNNFFMKKLNKTVKNSRKL